jgi:hypothetical protein
MIIKEYRKKPVTVRALKWEGGSDKFFNKVKDTLDRFVGLNWGRASMHKVPWNHEDKEEVVIYNHLEKCWIPCPVGHFIVQGVLGEFYPVEPEAFRKTYEEPSPFYPDDQ